MGYSIANKLGTEYLSARTVRENDAVMFDIDDTLLHTDGTPIEEIVDLFHTSMRLGYRVIIITARPDHSDIHDYTRQQLVSHELFPHEVYFVPPEEKDAVKKQTGLHYVLSVGDLETDLGLSDAFIKLPDIFDSNVYSNIQDGGTSFVLREGQ
jgi:hypothetical protein